MSRTFSQFITGKRLLQLTSALVSISLWGCDSSQNQTDLELGAATAAHVAIRVEAENYSNKHDRWHLTNPDTINGPDPATPGGPALTPDPDPSHHSTASSQGYVELLPDTRVTHNDEITGGVNYWGDGTNGPALEYMVTVPEAGRYYVYVKAYSTGLEDNGIHVGFNDAKPHTGKRIQLCSGKFRWTWSSAQRVPDNHCGVNKTIFLDIPYPGTHKIVFYAREDGFELDQFVLLKDPDDGTQDCYLYGDRVQCSDISTGEVIGTYDVPFTEALDGNTVISQAPPQIFVDLDIDLSLNTTSARVADELTYTVKVINKDNAEPATSAVASIELPSDMQFLSSSDCSANGNKITCNFSEISAGDTATAIFVATATASGTYRVDAKVKADQADRSGGNNAASLEIEAQPYIPDYDAVLAILQGSNTTGLNDSSTHLLIASNQGLLPLNNLQLSFSSGALTVAPELENCATDIDTLCTLNEIRVGESISIPLIVTGTTAGEHDLVIDLQTSADENPDNNKLNIKMRASNSVVSALSEGDLIIEAEEFNQHSSVSTPVEGTFNSQWFVNTAMLTATVTPDFDNTPADLASNTAYVELLPDTRTGQADSPVLGVSNFLTGEDSPALIYDAFVNESGTYIVNARIRANNEQDAVIHVGMDSQWPSSASNISVCNPNGEWQWTQSQADNGQCQPDQLATLEIPTPGLHKIWLSAGTDGVEVDKLILRKSADLPADLGGDPATYTATDIDLEIRSSVDSGFYSVEVINPDPVNTAVNAEVQFHGVALEDADLIEGFEQCIDVDGLVTCQLGYIPAAGSRIAELAVEKSDPKIHAFLNQANDPNPDNNSTVAKPSGGGTVNVLPVLFLLLLSGFRRR